MHKLLAFAPFFATLGQLHGIGLGSMRQAYRVRDLLLDGGSFRAAADKPEFRPGMMAEFLEISRYETDDIESGMISALESVPSAKSKDLLTTLDALDYYLFVVGDGRSAYFERVSGGALAIRSLPSPSSGSPPAPITTFRKFKKLYARRGNRTLDEPGAGQHPQRRCLRNADNQLLYCGWPNSW